MLQSLRKLLEHVLLILLLMTDVCCSHKARHNVYGDREYYCAIVLSGYAIERLEISQLKMLQLYKML